MALSAQWLGNRHVNYGIVVWYPETAVTRDISVSKASRVALGATSLLFNGYWELFPQALSSQGVKVAVHPHLSSPTCFRGVDTANCTFYLSLYDIVHNQSRFRWPCVVRCMLFRRLIVGIECSNPAEGMDFRLCLYCVGSGLCDELITCSEECYQVCVSNYVLSINLKRSGLVPIRAGASQTEREHNFEWWVVVNKELERIWKVTAVV